MQVEVKKKNLSKKHYCFTEVSLARLLFPFNIANFDGKIKINDYRSGCIHGRSRFLDTAHNIGSCGSACK
jgi:hypothetical protein